MANVSKSALRSRISLSVSAQPGARGFQKNPQDFSDLVGQRTSTQQEYMKRNWHYLTKGRLAHAARLSTTFKNVPIDLSTGQFGLSLN